MIDIIRDNRGDEGNADDERQQEILRRAIVNGGKVTASDCADLYDPNVPTPNKFKK